MNIKITFLNTGKIQTLEVSEILYTDQKIVLIQSNGGFTSFFHGDKVILETVQDKVNSENLLETHLSKFSQEEKLNEIYMHNEFMPVAY